MSHAKHELQKSDIVRRTNANIVVSWIKNETKKMMGRTDVQRMRFKRKTNVDIYFCLEEMRKIT